MLIPSCYNQKSGNISVWLEAECGTMGSFWEISADATASNGQYVAEKNGNTSAADAPDDSSGLVDYTFRVEEGGQFYVWARLICRTANDDSFWVKMDGGAWTLWNGIAPGATEWTWDKINQPFTLSEGFHTLTVGYREDGAWVDKWGITQSDAVPEGLGSEATNCGE